MILMLIRLVIVAIVGAAAYWWYGLVLPEQAAALMALLIGGAALYAMLAANLKFSLAAGGGAVFASWPLGALIAQAVSHALGHGELLHTTALAVAWPVPLVTEKFAWRVANKGDHARHWGGLVLGLIAVYTVLAAAWADNFYAMAAAAVGAGAMAVNAAQQLVIPPRIKQGLRQGAGVAGAAALLLLARAVTGY